MKNPMLFIPLLLSARLVAAPVPNASATGATATAAALFHPDAGAFPAEWTAEERPITPSVELGVRASFILDGPHAERIVVNVIDAKGMLLETWVRTEMLRAQGPGPEATACGSDTLFWSPREQDIESSALAVAFQRDSLIYQLSVAPGTGSDPDDTLSLLGQIHPALGNCSSFREALSSRQPLVTSCCGEADASRNSYRCCANGAKGNCTFWAELATSGADNFLFGGDGTGRDAYTWMSRAYSYYSDRYRFGTTPMVGAIMVVMNTYGTVGHVARVRALRTDGGVEVDEQNCSLSCPSRQKTYSLDFLRQNLAGYIYTGGSLPTITPKFIRADQVGRETVIEDHNQSDIYNFNGEGPGHVASLNGGFRAWGAGSNGGSNSFFRWTATKTGSSQNSGKWAFEVQAPGLYEIQAYVPNSTYASASRARYRVAWNGRVSYSRPVDQSANRGRWVRLVNPDHSSGNWLFNQGSGNGLRLEDHFGGLDSESGRYIAFDAVKFVFRGADGGGSGTATVLNEGAEAGAPGWSVSTRGTPWTIERSSDSRSGQYRFRTGAGDARYSNNTSTSLTSRAFSLTGKSTATLTFYTKYRMEYWWDWLRVEASRNGSTWTTLRSMTGTSPGWTGWTNISVNLASCLGSNTCRIRFTFTSDSSVTDWGVAIDDVLVTAR